MFKPTLIVLATACAAASATAATSAQELQYRVTVLSRNAVVFEGEGRTGTERPLELRQYVLARDNAGQGRSFVDSGVRVVVQPARRDAAAVSSRVTLGVPGQAAEAVANVELKLGEEWSADLGGYTVRLVATAVQPKASPAMPEDFAYIAPSLNLGSLALPNVWFDRQSYQVANAVLDRPADQQFATALVAPKAAARAFDVAPTLYAAQR